MDENDDLVFDYVTVLVSDALEQDDAKKVVLDTFYAGITVQAQMARSSKEDNDRILATIATVRSQFITHLKSEQSKLSKEMDGEQ